MSLYGAQNKVVVRYEDLDQEDWEIDIFVREMSTPFVLNRMSKKIIGPYRWVLSCLQIIFCIQGSFFLNKIFFNFPPRFLA